MQGALLPSFFRFNTALDLVRIGRDFDGGYLISKNDIEKSNTLVSLGINDDWSFEKHFLKIKQVPIYAYDASVGLKVFLKNLAVSLPRVDRPERIMHWLRTLIDYRRFFSQPGVKHISKFVGLDSDSPLYETMQRVLEAVPSDDIYLKVDIEGSEYRIIETIIAHQHRFSGIAIEFHDCDIHLDSIKSFINAINLKIVHIHANNYGAIRRSDGMPLVLEVTFSRYAHCANSTQLPHPLDMPNNDSCPEIELKVDV